MLLQATGCLMQHHAFDHLPENKLSRIRQCMNQTSHKPSDNALMHSQQNDLLELFCEADIFSETITPQSLDQWLATMHYFGKSTDPVMHEMDSEEE